LAAGIGTGMPSVRTLSGPSRKNSVPMALKAHRRPRADSNHY
jgi:hypothetical protein